MGYHHLTTDARCQIYALKSTGIRQKDIAKFLKVSPSTISRELRRNSGPKGYHQYKADNMAIQRRTQASARPTRMTAEVVTLVKAKLHNEWSPEQISGRLKLSGIHVSHEG